MVCFDFITGLKADVVALRLCTSLRDGAGVYHHPSMLPPIYTSNQPFAALGIRQPVERFVRLTVLWLSVLHVAITGNKTPSQ